MSLCPKCQNAEAGGHLYLAGWGIVCYSCFQKGNEPRRLRTKAKKTAIARPEQELDAWAVKA